MRWGRASTSRSIREELEAVAIESKPTLGIEEFDNIQKTRAKITSLMLRDLASHIHRG